MRFNYIRGQAINSYFQLTEEQAGVSLFCEPLDVHGGRDTHTDNITVFL